MLRDVYADAFRTLAATVRRRGMRRTDIRASAELCAAAVIAGFVTQDTLRTQAAIANDDTEGFLSFLDGMADVIATPTTAH